MPSKQKAELSFAIAVMSKLRGWEEEHWVVARMWIYTKVVISNGQNHMQNNGLFKFMSVMEAVN